MTFLLLALACQSAPLSLSEAESEALEVETRVDEDSETVLTVTWTTETTSDAVLEYGTDDRYGAVVEGWSSDDGLEHAVVLAGLSADLEWHWRAVAQTEDGELVSADGVFQPPSPPNDLPRLQVAGNSDQLVLSPVIGGESFAAIYNGAGEPVWWRKLSTSPVTFTQARMSHDGKAVIVMATLPELGESMAIVRMPVAGGAPVITYTPNGHHDFVELPTGGYAVLVKDVRPFGSDTVEGDAIVEFELDGTSRTVWSTWDAGDPDHLDAMATLVSGDKEWTHDNSLALLDGNYWVSSHRLCTVSIVHAQTGALVAELGSGGDVALTGGDGFGPQHAALPVEGGFLVFNNRPTNGGEMWSEAVQYDVDLRAGTYARAWSYDADRSVTTRMLGNVEPLPQGGHLVSWGSAGRLTILNEAHEPTWEASAPLGHGFGYSHAVRDFSGEP